MTRFLKSTIALKHKKPTVKISSIIFSFITSAFFVIPTNAEAQVNKNSDDYKNAYSCGIEAAKNGSTDVNSIISFCIGNSHDPSKTEIQGFNDAIFNVRNSKKLATCTFGYGIYEANGSRSDNFEEGPQKITSMRQIAELMPSRDFTIYDQAGKPFSKEEVNKLFYIVSSNQYGINKIGLTKFALQNCSKKQLGK